jgi:hypothetical protein
MYTRLVPTDDGYEQPDDPLDLGLVGPDPAVDAAGDRVVLAWPYGTSADVARPLGIAMLGSGGEILAGPCRLPTENPIANEPAIACGGGWCLVTWIEATSLRGTDYLTRVVQVPVDGAEASFCP